MSEKRNYVPYYPKIKPDPKYPSGYDKRLLTKHEQMSEVFGENYECLSVAFDCETEGLNSELHRMVGYSFSFDGEKGYYVPMRHVIGDNMPLEVARAGLSFLVARKLLLYNAKFDLRFIRSEGFDIDKVEFLDIQALVWNIDTNVKSPRLKDAMKSLLGWEETKTFEVTLGGQKGFQYLDPQTGYEYAVFDAIALIQLIKTFAEFYAENRSIIDLDSMVVRELMKIEDVPHLLDIELLSKICDSVDMEIQSVGGKIIDLAGYSFNIASSQQTGEMLQKLGITTGKKTEKTGKMQVNLDSLESIKDVHPVIPEIINYKSLLKLQNSYAEKLRDSCKANLHGCRFNYFAYGVPTGRLASGADSKNSYFAEYNIQSTAKASSCMYRVSKCDPSYSESLAGWLFVKDEEKGYIEGESGHYNVRRVFIPDPDCYFFHADYSGQELRIPANLSKDPVMVGAFLSGEDFHKKIALQLVDGDESKYNKDLRKLAKACNFGNLYGGDAKTISENTGVSIERAEEIYQKWWSTLSVLREWVKSVQKYAREKGWIKTPFGRIRRLKFYYDDPRKNMQAFADRSAVNSLIQGAAGDMMRIALVRLGKLIEEVGDKRLRILSSVHDEINISLPKDRLFLIPKILECMNVSLKEWQVPMEIDWGLGYSWGEFFSFEFKDNKLVPKGYKENG